jgi:uroporphyrinogen-III synthase
MPDELRGIVALVTRPAGRGDALAAAIRHRGGRALECPLLAIQPLTSDPPALAEQLAQCQIAIFISTNAVSCALAAVRAAGFIWPPAICCLAVGSATRDALRREGLAASDAGGEVMNSEELLRHPALAQASGLRVLVFKGEGGREFLAAELRARGAVVEECALYRRELPADASVVLERLLDANRVNVFLANSGETLANLLGLLEGMPAGKVPGGAFFLVPGERVAAEARWPSQVRVVTARNASDAAMLEALEGIAQALGGKTEQT